MSAEENKALVRRFVEELDRGNLDVIDELLAPDFVDRSMLRVLQAHCRRDAGPLLRYRPHHR